MIIDNYVFSQPAFLVGNGINRYDGDGSWWKLLEEISENSLNLETYEEEEIPGASYPEIAEILELKFRNGHLRNTDSIKKRISEHKYNGNGNTAQKKLISFAIEKNIPVLTTNYDSSLLQFQIQSKKERGWYRPFRNNDSKNNGYSKNSYNLNDYFSVKQFNNETNIFKTFSLWYLHGLNFYIKSICINNVDYANKTAKVKEYLRNINEENHVNQNWIDIFMNNDLIIFGLGLEVQETDLRWLLCERWNYQRKLEEKYSEQRLLYTKKHTLYIYKHDSEKPLKKGMRLFFKQLGIELVKMDDYKNIYDNYRLFIT